MAVTANSIITPQTPKSAQAATSAAQATFPPTTTPSNTVLLLTAGANGARVTRIRATPQTTITANHCQLYRSPDGGTTKYFVHGALMSAATVNSTTQATPTDFGYSDANPLILGATEKLYVASGLSTACVFDADYQDY
jgi:hypothetical protein